jgi:hypothetical protein
VGKAMPDGQVGQDEGTAAPGLGVMPLQMGA